MGEEFQESDVIWPDHQPHHHLRRDDGGSVFENDGAKISLRRKNAKKKQSNSLPVTIPENIARRSWLHCTDSDEGDGVYDDGEIVPPHVIVSRRIAGKMAFSVCTGNGRTLKGRDLSQVRNSILRMTGFLEP